MTDVPPEEPEAPLPRWVPLTIGAVLVLIASLAVITGLRYRENTLVHIVKPRPHPRTTTPAPAGEPEAGASLVSAGVPAASAPVQGEARAVVTGDTAGINAVVRMWARRGLQVQVTPENAMVYINNVPVGEASQFDSENEIYDFAEPGSYTVRIVAPGYKERQYVVTAQETARSEVARIVAKLDKEALGPRP